jgi:hypothetical protein
MKMIGDKMMNVLTDELAALIVEETVKRTNSTINAANSSVNTFIILSPIIFIQINNIIFVYFNPLYENDRG